MSEELYELLVELAEHFDDMADAEYFTDSPNPVPNTEMKFLCRIEEFMKEYQRLNSAMGQMALESAKAL